MSRSRSGRLDRGDALPRPGRRALPLLLLAGPVRAATAAVPGVWRFDARHGEAGLAVRAVGFVPVRGRFAEFVASISPAAAEVRVAAASLSLSTPAYDERVRGPEWLDAARFPEAALRVPGPFRAASGAEDRAGVLTLRGVPRPVVARLSWAEGPGGVSVEASCAIRRSEFGMVADRLTVGDQVTLSLSVRRQAQ